MDVLELKTKPKQTSKDLLERRNRVMPKAIQLTNSINADHAKGAFFYDVEGNEYLDFSGGIGVLNAGHCPPSVSKAIAQQSAKLMHIFFNLLIGRPDKTRTVLLS